MKKFLLLHKIDHRDRSRVGGKGFVLSKMAEMGLLVPVTACITADAYNEYLDRTGLRERIMLEIHRKDLSDMRWEEIWDASARIRNMLLNTLLPEPLDSELKNNIDAYFSDVVCEDGLFKWKRNLTVIDLGIFEYPLRGKEH